MGSACLVYNGGMPITKINRPNEKMFSGTIVRTYLVTILCLTSITNWEQFQHRLYPCVIDMNVFMKSLYRDLEKRNYCGRGVLYSVHRNLVGFQFL